MRFDRLDLNLLVALDVLIEERSVSAAAKRLHLSQPAVSGALNRLREFFADELLVQSGRQMLLTAKAEDLAVPVRQALTLIRTRITTPAVFDPASAERIFSLIASDYAFNVLLADVVAEVAHIAPAIGFEIIPPEPRSIERLERGELDLAVTIETHLVPEFPRLPLYEDEHAIICWSGGPHAAGMDADGFIAASHAVAYFGPARLTAFSENWFDRQGLERRIDVRVPSFTMLPQAVIHTARVATLQRRYAEYYARFLPIAVLPMPFDIPLLREMVQWHPMRDRDDGLKWLIDLIRRHAFALEEGRARDC